jgi:hypothetical protein
MEIITPPEHMGSLMELAQERRVSTGVMRALSLTESFRDC